jgi:hypothetical protein
LEVEEERFQEEVEAIQHLKAEEAAVVEEAMEREHH